MVLFPLVAGAQLHRRLLGQVYRQPGLKAGQPDGDVPGELCGALHRHHPDHHQPLHTDGAEGRSLSTPGTPRLSVTSRGKVSRSL